MTPLGVGEVQRHLFEYQERGRTLWVGLWHSLLTPNPNYFLPHFSSRKRFASFGRSVYLHTKNGSSALLKANKGPVQLDFTPFIATLIFLDSL